MTSKYDEHYKKRKSTWMRLLAAVVSTMMLTGALPICAVGAEHTAEREIASETIEIQETLSTTSHNDSFEIETVNTYCGEEIELGTVNK